jgi:hypothetical protein
LQSSPEKIKEEIQHLFRPRARRDRELIGIVTGKAWETYEAVARRLLDQLPTHLLALETRKKLSHAVSNFEQNSKFFGDTKKALSVQGRNTNPSPDGR